MNIGLKLTSPLARNQRPWATYLPLTVYMRISVYFKAIMH